MKEYVAFEAASAEPTYRVSLWWREGSNRVTPLAGRVRERSVRMPVRSKQSPRDHKLNQGVRTVWLLFYFTMVATNFAYIFLERKFNIL
jgi:hypothetical protein